MKKIKILLIIINLLLTGCYNYRELNDLGITTAIGIERKNDEFTLYTEVLNTTKNDEKDNTAKFAIFESHGKTIQEALRNTILSSSKRLYANHMQILIIDEETAKNGIGDIIDLFFRDPESRKQFYVFISKTNIKDIFNIETPLDKVNSNSIFERVKANNNYLGNSLSITFSDMISKYVNPYIEITLPTLMIKDSNILISDTAIFKDDQLKGYISNDETILFNLITNNINDTILTALDNNKYISIEINNSETKYKVKDEINIDISLSGNIAEVDSSLNLTNPNSIKYIEKLFEKDLSTRISNFIEKTKSYNIDILGLKDLIYKKNNKNFSDNINIKNIKINNTINVKLKYKGNGAYELNEK